MVDVIHSESLTKKKGYTLLLNDILVLKKLKNFMNYLQFNEQNIWTDEMTNYPDISFSSNTTAKSDSKLDSHHKRCLT